MKKLKQKYRCIEELKYGNDKTTRCPTEIFGHDGQRGFTLVELVITIAIIIILSVISVPIYRGYVDKAELAEGYALLGAILSAQKAYYSENGTFLRDGWNSGYTCNETKLGVDARGNKYFTWFLAGGSGGEGTERFWTGISKPDKFKDPNKVGIFKNYLMMFYSIDGGATIM